MPGLPPSGRKKRGKRGSDKEEKPPLHIIMNLVCILIPALLAQQVTDFYQHQVELPTRGGPGGASDQPAPTHEPFNLKLTLGLDGEFMIVNARTLSAGESGLVAQGPGLLLGPGANGKPQYKVLQLLLTKEKEQRLGGEAPEAYPDPDQITVSCPGEMEYERIVQALDFVRFQPAPDFLPDVPALFTVISLSPGSIGG